MPLLSILRGLAAGRIIRIIPTTLFSILAVLAGSTGLEPATSGVTGRRSNQLNYDPAVEEGASYTGRLPLSADGAPRKTARFLFSAAC